MSKLRTVTRRWRSNKPNVTKIDRVTHLPVDCDNTPALNWQWKDTNDNFHHPRDMETRHVFFTLRMIWNHVVPKEMQIEPFKRYRFSSFYTQEYMEEAVRVLSAELSTRNDLTPYYKKCIQIIVGHLNIWKGQGQING